MAKFQEERQDAWNQALQRIVFKSNEKEQKRERFKDLFKFDVRELRNLVKLTGNIEYLRLLREKIKEFYKISEEGVYKIPYSWL